MTQIDLAIKMLKSEIKRIGFERVQLTSINSYANELIETIKESDNNITVPTKKCAANIIYEAREILNIGSATIAIKKANYNFFNPG